MSIHIHSYTCLSFEGRAVRVVCGARVGPELAKLVAAYNDADRERGQKAVEEVQTAIDERIQEALRVGT